LIAKFVFVFVVLEATQRSLPSLSSQNNNEKKSPEDRSSRNSRVYPTRNELGKRENKESYSGKINRYQRQEQPIIKKNGRAEGENF
jgi:hypothetical protein